MLRPVHEVTLASLDRSTWGLAGAALAFLVSLVGSVWLVAFVLNRLPADYFLSRKSPEHLTPRQSWPAWVGRNVAGAVLILLGIFMSVPGVPGQGLLTIFIGIVLIDVPGKKALERRFVRLPKVLHAINALRARFGHPPLHVD